MADCTAASSESQSMSQVKSSSCLALPQWLARAKEVKMPKSDPGLEPYIQYYDISGLKDE